MAAALAMSVEEEAPVETKEETPEDKEKAMEKVGGSQFDSHNPGFFDYYLFYLS